LELTIGSINIVLEPSGPSRLSDSTKSNPSANKPEIEETLQSSEGSSSEVNSPVIFYKAPIAEGGKIRENFDSEKRACQKHNNVKDLTTGSSSVSRVHQLCLIILIAEEENNSGGSDEVDRQVDKIKNQSKKEKEKVHISSGEWRMIKSAVHYGTEVPEGSRREVLMGYQYALYQHRKKLREERDMVLQNNESMSEEEYWEDYSEDSEYNREKRGDPKHNRGATAHGRKERYSFSLAPQIEEEEDDFGQKTPEEALAAAHAYLLATRLEPGDPREEMHRAAIQSLGIIGGKIREQGPEMKSTSHGGSRKEKIRCNFTSNEYSDSSEEKKRHKRKEDARSIITQARIKKSRHAWREENYEDDDKDMGALCFTRRVRKTQVPKGFKLPHDQHKYDGSQEPALWLAHYLQAVEILGGTKH
jgi:hypothetical protein